MDDKVDPVASAVTRWVERVRRVQENGDAVDGWPVWVEEDKLGHRYYHIRLNCVLSHAYDRYLPILKDRFSDFDVAAIVNWHEGANAPPSIFCAHTTGDVPSGVFGPAHPGYTRALLRALEKHRVAAGLEAWTVLSEATHWSGLPHGGQPSEIPEFDVPLLDVEIGSEPESWSDPRAIEVLGRALGDVFEGETSYTSVLCGGGVHFERAFGEAVLLSEGKEALAVSHILPNQWLVSGGYDGPDAVQKLEACVASIAGGVDLIALHDKLKASYKDPFRELGTRLDIPIVKHKALRAPGLLPLGS